jgi:mono/diheme cytochrome c family protein
MGRVNHGCCTATKAAGRAIRNSSARPLLSGRERGGANVARRRWRPSFAIIALLLAAMAYAEIGTGPAQAEDAVLVIRNGATEQRFTTSQLLSRPDIVALAGTGDIYRHQVVYRALPLSALLGSGRDSGLDTVEAAGRDGFVSQIPFELIARGTSGGSVAYIAIEDPAHPWPSLPKKTETAGPFYLIWDHPERSGITREQSPYQLVSLTFTESPVHRWPQLAVPANMPSDATARHGQDVFVTQCLPCHTLNGGGASDTGPDLERPMSPTQYLTDAGLRAIIRNPKGVRSWPGQQMIGFSATILSDADLDALVAYLRTMSVSSVGCPDRANDRSCTRK